MKNEHTTDSEKSEHHSTKVTEAAAHPEIDSIDKEPTVPELQAEVERYRDAALRASADLENYRKRMIREKEEAIRFANAGLLEKLLPILDNFELGLEAAKGDESAKGIVNGFSMIHRQLGDFLQASGLQPIDAIGQTFDPKLHDALGHENDPAQEDGIILRQLRRGYRLANRLVRPASVIVNKA